MSSNIYVLRLTNITLIDLVIVMRVWYSRWKLSLWKRLGVPGPPPTIFVGHGGLYNKYGMFKLDQEMIAKYGNVVGLYLGHSPTVLISDPELIKDVLVKDFSKNPNRPQRFKAHSELKHGLPRLKDDHWRFMRKTISTTFSSGKLRKMEKTLGKKCQNLSDALKLQATSGQHIKCNEMFGNFTMDCIAALGFGMEIDTQANPENDFFRNAKALVATKSSKWLIVFVIFPCLLRVLDIFGLSPLKKRQNLGFFRSVVEGALKKRDKTDTDEQDLLQLMLNAHTDTDVIESEDVDDFQNKSKKWKRGLSMDEVMGNSMLFLLAGYETTGKSLTFMSYCLATNPECQDKLIEEIDAIIGKELPTYDKIQKMEYLDCVFNETLRLFPPAIRTSRNTEKDFSLAGYRIPKDTELAFPIFAVHRSSKYWQDPDKFDPERFKAENKSKRNPNAFLPFGLGPRHCVAMRLAHMEAKSAIITVLQNYKLITCAETEIPLKLSKSFTLLKPDREIILKLEARSSTK